MYHFIIGVKRGWAPQNKEWYQRTTLIQDVRTDHFVLGPGPTWPKKTGTGSGWTWAGPS